jgi:hypothetical protein
MDDDLMKQLRDEFELALDEMAGRLREVRRYSAMADEPGFHDAVEAYERARWRWLEAYSALREASVAADRQTS